MKSVEKPQFFGKQAKVDNFLSKNKFVTYVDAFYRQLKELFLIENHAYIGMDKKKVYKSADFKIYTAAKEKDAVFIYYPWNHNLVKVVNKADYYCLKTNRNEGLISVEEQARLRNYKVAVLGMSVGSNIAIILTQAGISNQIILADFDELDTTNLNRILGGVHQVGLNKTVIAARKIYEDNPYAEVTLLKEGINEVNLEELIKARKIDCIVEEIDDIAFKIHCRILAMKYKIPVLMVTDNGDGIVLHVERYDLGHDKLWGKNQKYFEDKLADGPITKEKAGQMIANDFVGGIDKVDPKMRAAIPKVINKELVSWPQLGSAAILGGVVITAMIKKMVAGESRELDIRSYISPTDISHSSHI